MAALSTRPASATSPSDQGSDQSSAIVSDAYAAPTTAAALQVAWKPVMMLRP